MESSTNNINLLSDVLLELTLSIGSHEESDSLIRKSVPLLLKRLECNVCGIFYLDADTNYFQFEFIVPGIFPKTKEIILLKEELFKLQTDNKPHFNFSIENQFYYFFQKSKNEYLLLRRKVAFSEVQVKELQPILLFLYNTYKNLNEKRRRKRVEKELERLSLVASQTTNGVIITDLEGKLQWINDGFTKISGYKLEEVRGKCPGHFLQGPETDPETIDIMRKAIRNNNGFDVEILNYNKQKKSYWIKISCNPMKDHKGNITGFMAIESNISIQKQYENELIEAKNAAIHAQKAEETFLANMSHEIRTPLNAVIGMTSLLYETRLNNEQLDYVKTLDHSANFLLGLISNVLDIAKIQAGKIDIIKANIDFYSILDNLQLTYENRVKEKGLKVIVEKSDDVPQNIISDKTILQQILNNLLSNAEKFTNEGEIGVNVKKVIWNDKESLQLEVFDTGAGIPEEKMKFLFQKFKQIHSAELTNTRGTGLGLAITKQLVEILNGTIKVESKANFGTKFIINFPLELPKTKKVLTNNVSKGIIQKNDFSEILVLIVEDNFMNQKFITILLDKMNIKYELAENGEQTLEKIKVSKFDVILMDIQLPDMNGFEISKIIRNSDNINKHSKIIALTASAMSQDVLKAEAVGMDGFLSKPFKPKDLITKLNLVLD